MQQDQPEMSKISPSPSQVGQDLPPLSRTGSPSAAEKDILVCIEHVLSALYLI